MPVAQRDLNWSLEVNTAPTDMPVSLADCKAYLGQSQSHDDSLIEDLIWEAADKVEEACNEQLMSATLVLRIHRRFPEVIFLVRSPVQSVTTIEYVDTDGVTQTLSASYYDTDLYSQPARITEAYNQTWPTTRDQDNAVVITYVAGYTSAANVPRRYRNAIKDIAAVMYDTRGRTPTMTLEGAQTAKRIDEILVSVAMLSGGL